MARFLVLWRVNPVAPWPAEPSEHLKLDERMYAAIGESIKKGEIEDFGFFLEGNSGYGIGRGESIDIFRSLSMFLPYIICEVHEIIPFEKGKEITIALLKAAAAKK